MTKTIFSHSYKSLYKEQKKLKLVAHIQRHFQTIFSSENAEIVNHFKQA